MAVPGITIDEAALATLSDRDRHKLEKALAELQLLAKENPLQLYRPHEKQIPFHLAHVPVRAFLGGNRSGKTTAGIVDDLIQAVDAEALPEHLLPYKCWEPPFFCRIVVPDFTATLEGVVFPKIRDWVPRQQLHRGSWERAFDKQLRRLMFKNGSWFQFMTFEQDLDKFGGAALHRIHHDEEPPEDIRQECQMRLIDFGGDEIFTMTPLHGMTWMYDKVYQRKDEDDYAVIEVDMDDNPHLDQVTKVRLLDGLTEEERLARKCGKFVHFGGVVFDEFDPDIHLVPDEKIDPEYIGRQTVYVGIDPGLNKTAVSFVAFDKDNSALVFDELYLSNATVETAAFQIKQKLTDWGAQGKPLIPSMFIIDPSARNRSLTNAEQVQGEYARFGIYCAPGQNAIEAGLFQMKRRLQNRAPDGTPSPTLRFSSRCRWHRWEIQRYRREQRPDGSFKTVAGDDHLIDANRYVCSARPWGAPNELNNSTRPRYQHGYMPPWDGSPDIQPDAPPMGFMS